MTHPPVRRATGQQGNRGGRGRGRGESENGLTGYGGVRPPVVCNNKQTERERERERESEK